MAGVTYVHRPITLVLDWIEEQIFFARFDRMGRADANVVDPAILLVGKESIFSTFECFGSCEMNDDH